MLNIHRQYLLALGGNLPSEVGNPAQTLTSALCAIAAEPCCLTAVSRFFATPCFPAGAGPDYVNAAISVTSDLPPLALLERIHHIEAQFGRQRQQRWGMRTLDIDLIACQDLVLPDPATQQHWRQLPTEEQLTATPEQLILPHPRLQERAFVLVPLNDIACRWVHPILKQSVAKMLLNLPKSERNAVVPL